MDNDRRVDGDFREWFHAEWTRLRKLYGVADRGTGPLPPVPTLDELEEKLAEMDALVILASAKDGTVRRHPEAVKAFAARLRGVFKRYSLVRKAVAARMGYRSCSSPYQWLSGMVPPTPEAWEKLKDAIRREAGG